MKKKPIERWHMVHNLPPGKVGEWLGHLCAQVEFNPKSIQVFQVHYSPVAERGKCYLFSHDDFRKNQKGMFNFNVKEKKCLKK